MGKSLSNIACLTLAALCRWPQSVQDADAKVPWASTSFVSGIPATGERKKNGKIQDQQEDSWWRIVPHAVEASLAQKDTTEYKTHQTS